MTKKILITGAAGFIGFNTIKKLANYNYQIIGLDNINDYYSIQLKYDRLSELGIVTDKIIDNELIYSNSNDNVSFIKADVSDFDFLKSFFLEHNFDYVIHLAAQAGVRYSLINPRVYLKSNVDGFLSLLEACRTISIKHLIYASTSSVYGLNSMMPLNENFATEHPVSLYAATKKANEMMAHSYSHLFNIPTTGLRFFTVYGPWGRPDMALSLFVDSILNDRPIKIFNNGQMKRDFTFIDDVTESILRLIIKPPIQSSEWDSIKVPSSSSSAPFQLFNVGNSNPINLLEYIQEIEKQLEKKSLKEFLPLQKGDVLDTHANVEKLMNYINFRPKTTLSNGISLFVKWYKEYYNY
jgi:UDP-glucuronate 4-epimerase